MAGITRLSGLPARRQLGIISALLCVVLTGPQGWAQSLPWPVWPDSSTHAVSYGYGGYQAMWREELLRNVDYYHTGMDIPGAEWEAVRAVEPGYVKAVLTIFDSENHWRVIIADSAGTGECEGWLYAHLIPFSTAVSVGDHVEAGDSLGVLVTWPYPSTPTHLHFSRIRFAGDSAAWANGFWDYEYPANPMLYIGPAGDTMSPFFMPALATQLFAFCGNQSRNFFAVGEPLSGDVDVICSAYDYCNYSAIRTAPYRIEYKIEGDSSTPWILSFEFSGSIGSYNGDMESFSHLTYKYASPCSTFVGDSLVAFFIMTNTDGDGILETSDAGYSWNTAHFHNGEYTVFGRLSDFDGNSTVDSMAVTVANSFTLAGTITLEGINHDLEGTELWISPDSLTASTQSDGSYHIPAVGGGYQSVATSRAGYETSDTVLLMDRDRQLDVVLSLRDFVCGNTDGLPPINAADIIFLVNYVYRSGPAPIPIDVANVNGDEAVTAADIVYLVNYVFKSGAAPHCL